MSECYQIYTHNDLDGAVSLLVFLWAFPDAHIKWKSISNLQIDNLKLDLDEAVNPCSTYILDLALRESFLPDLDRDYVTFIDHHETSESFVGHFKNAKIIYENLSSNALLMNKTFKGGNFLPRNDKQKTLIALADDYDCYKLQIPESYDLNILFWSQYKNNFSKFIKDYQEGFKGFSPEQKRAIAYIKKNAEEESSKLNLFSGSLTIGGKKKTVLAALTDKFSSIIMDVLIKRYDPDLFFFINSKSEKVCIRQPQKKDPINVGDFAEKICDGGGHRYAGGGVITPTFMEITKNLSPLEVNKR